MITFIKTRGAVFPRDGFRIQCPQYFSRLVFMSRMRPFVRAKCPIKRAQTRTATCRSGPSSYLGPRPCFYGMRAGPPGATVGVLAMGVPRSTCWKAQLRPIYINTTSSSSTSPRAQDPHGGMSREEVQDKLDEGFP